MRTHHSSEESERRNNKHTRQNNNKTLTPIVKNKYNVRYACIDISITIDIE